MMSLLNKILSLGLNKLLFFFYITNKNNLELFINKLLMDI